MPNCNAGRPTKPRPDFPLFPHASGRWAKKVRGKLEYFGYWTKDPDGEAALDQWNAVKDYLLAGRRPPAHIDGISVQELVNRFLAAKKARVDSGEMTARSWFEYDDALGKALKAFGPGRQVSDLTPADFQSLRASLAKGRGVQTLSGLVQRIRSAFKWGYESDLIDRPVKFGPDFKQPSKDAKRKAANKRPARLFTADEIRAILDKASVPLKAMALLGANCGLGNADCSELPQSALDLDRGILDYPRAKTGIQRRAILWPETVTALREAVATRPPPKDPADAALVFVTRYGQRWVKYRPAGVINGVTQEFNKLLDELGIDRAGVSFYSLRHTFETIAGQTGDQIAVDRVMGHVTPGMGENYRHWLRDEAEDARLRKIADHVHAWLFPPAASKTRPAKKSQAKTRQPKRPSLRLAKAG